MTLNLQHAEGHKMWTDEELVAMFAEEVGDAYDRLMEVPDPGAEHRDELEAASDRFFIRILGGSIPSDRVRDHIRQRVVHWAPQSRDTLRVDVRTQDEGEIQTELDRMPQGPPERDAGTDKKTMLTLAQALGDHDAIKKFGFTPGFLTRVENLANTQPARSVEWLNLALEWRGFTSVRVKLGNYPRNAQRTRRRIMDFAAGAPQLPPDSTEIVGDKILMHYAPAGTEIEWSVGAHLRHAETLLHFYRVCLLMGPSSATVFLAVEVEVLHIMSWNARTNEHYAAVIENHVAEDGIDEWDDDVEGPTAAQRLMLKAAAEAVRPIRMGDRIMASAVQVTGTHALVCGHVLESAGGSDVTISGEKFVPVESVGPDLWVAEAPFALERAWRMREAVSGEPASIVYQTLHGSQYTSMVVVNTADGTTVTTDTPVEARKGMSGAALVALNDGALLGIYRGQASAQRQALFSVFSPHMFSRLSELNGVRSAPPVDDDRYTERVIQSVETRGYMAAMRAAYDCLEPLFRDGVHVANGMCMCTTAYGRSTRYLVVPESKADLPYRYEDGAALQLERADQGRSLTMKLNRDMGIIPVARPPSIDEVVIVLGKTRDGLFISRPSKVVKKALSKTREQFSVEAIDDEGVPLAGCLVWAWNDGCVLGQVVQKEKKTGYYACSGAYQLPTTDHLNQVSKVLTDVLGSLVAPSLWDPEELTLMLTHPAGADRLQEFAAIGDASMKETACRYLRELGVPVSMWTIITSVTLSNKALIRVYNREGFASLIYHQPNAIAPPPDSKFGADVIEALVGIASVYQGPEAARALALRFGAGEIPEAQAEVLEQRGVKLHVPPSPLEQLRTPWGRAGPSRGRLSWHGPARSRSPGVRVPVLREVMGPPSSRGGSVGVPNPIVEYGPAARRRSSSAGVSMSDV